MSNYPRYVKLGKKAKGGSFHCPVTGLSLSGEQVAKMPNNAVASKIIGVAHTNNHIVEATEEEFNEFKKAEQKRNKAGKAESEKRLKIRDRIGKPLDNDEVTENEDDEEEEEDDDEDGEEKEGEGGEEDEEDETDDMTKSQLLEALTTVGAKEAEIKASKSSLSKLKALYKKYKKK